MIRISDIEIIKILRSNARTPYTEIAKQFNVSEATIRKRIKKMIDKKVIRKITIEVDMKKLGYEIEALIGIDTTPEDYIKVLNYLKEQEEVHDMYTSTGDHMMMILCYFKDNDELSSYVQKIESIKGVTKVCPAILLNKIK